MSVQVDASRAYHFLITPEIRGCIKWDSPCLRPNPSRRAPPSSRPLLSRMVVVVWPVALDNARAKDLLHLVVRVQVARLDREDAACGDDGPARVHRLLEVL